jgi:hypothetical protein
VGPVDPNNPFATQVHDFNPGIAPNGLLWTVELPPQAVRADLGVGTALLQSRRIEVGDAHTIPESLSKPEGGPSVPATVSFDVWWGDPTGTKQVADPAAGFAGTFLEVATAIAFTAETADFAFVSDPPDTSQGLFGWLGYETNGAYAPAPAATPTA